MFFTLVVFLLVLLVLVLAHEWGHFFVARRFGVKVEEFGFGFPPKIFSVRRQGTVYSFNWIPLGGFVRLKGEDGSNAEETDSFAHQSAKKRSAILLAGVVMNVVVAYVLLVIALGVGYRGQIDPTDQHAEVRDRAITVTAVLANAPAAGVGILSGDEILAVNGAEVTAAAAVRPLLQSWAEKKVDIRIRRVGVERDVSVVPTTIKPGVIGIGVQLTDVGQVRYPFPYALWQGAKDCGAIARETWQALRGVIGTLITEQRVVEGVSGPVGIAQITGMVARTGLISLLQLMAVLSINLALLNVLPFPALDGGRVLFVLIEKVWRRKIRSEIERVTHLIGFILLMALVVAVTYRDIVGLLR